MEVCTDPGLRGNTGLTPQTGATDLGRKRILRIATFLVTPDGRRAHQQESSRAEHPKDILKCFLCRRMVKLTSGPGRGLGCKMLTWGEKGKEGYERSELSLSQPHAWRQRIGPDGHV